MNLTKDEIGQIFSAVKPMFDRSGGNPEETKAALREAFAERPCPAEVQDLFLHAIDVLAQLRTEKQKGEAIPEQTKHNGEERASCTITPQGLACLEGTEGAACTES